MNVEPAVPVLGLPTWDLALAALRAANCRLRGLHEIYLDGAWFWAASVQTAQGQGFPPGRGASAQEAVLASLAKGAWLGSPGRYAEAQSASHQGLGPVATKSLEDLGL